MLHRTSTWSVDQHHKCAVTSKFSTYSRDAQLLRTFKYRWFMTKRKVMVFHLASVASAWVLRWPLHVELYLYLCNSNQFIAAMWKIIFLFFFQKLGLASNAINPRACFVICQGLLCNSAIRSIDLSSNSLGQVGVGWALCISPPWTWILKASNKYHPTKSKQGSASKNSK